MSGNTWVPLLLTSRYLYKATYMSVGGADVVRSAAPELLEKGDTMTVGRKPLVAAIAVAVATILPIALEAQEGEIAGRVTSAATGEAVDGATVRVVGTDIGTITSSDGTYRLSGIEAGDVRVRANRLGFASRTQSVTVPETGTVTVAFQLRIAGVELDDIVASIEAAAVEREEVGTTVARISSEEVEGAALTTFSDLINARAENVQISRGDGQVGTGSRIRVRGATSITQDNVPLIVIDGIRASNNLELPLEGAAGSGLGVIDQGGQTTSRFEDFRPQDIESIEVVKGPTATALYGSEAASGVMVIKTKRGSRDQSPRVNLRVRQGFQEDNADYPDNYSDITAGFGISDPDDPKLSGFRTDQNPLTGSVFLLDNPLEEDPDAFRTGYIGDFAGTVSGGGENTQYYGSLQYERNEAAIPSNELQRLSARANASLHPGEEVEVALSTLFTTSDIDLADTSTQFGWVTGSVLGIPTLSFGNEPSAGQGPCALDVLSDAPEPTGACDDRDGMFVTTFENLVRQEQGEELDRFTGSASVDVTPTHWFTLSATGGVDVVNQRVHELTPVDPDGVFGGRSRGVVVDSRQRGITTTGDVGGTLEFNLPGGIRSTTSGGAQAFIKEMRREFCEGDTFASPQIRSCDAALVSRGGSDNLENVEIGAFLQERVGWNDWVFATGAVRVDDNSALGDQTDVVVSPSVNTSVVLSDAPFWDIAGDVVDRLRVRGAWGKASQSPDQFAADRTFISAPATVDGTRTLGLTASDPGNPELDAERNEELEVGLDAELLEGRIGVRFTYFDQKTTDAIVPIPVSPSSGFPNDRFINLAEVDNKGIEVDLDGRVLDMDDVQWDVRLAVSTTDPVVTDLGRDEPLFFPRGDVGTTRATNSQVFATGLPPGAYVSRVVENATRDEDGNITDFTLASEDPRVGSGRRVVGSPLVTDEESVSTTVTLFDNIRIFTLFDRDGGNDLLFVQQAFRTPFIAPAPGLATSSTSRRWAFRQLEDSPEAQAAMEQDFLEPFVFDGSFIRWRELTASYDLPNSIVEQFGGSDATVRVGGRNLSTFTDFPGVDPEGNIQGAQDNFIRNSSWTLAQPQTYFAEIRVTF